jgi:hypothetical protein
MNPIVTFFAALGEALKLPECPWEVAFEATAVLAPAPTVMNTPMALTASAAAIALLNLNIFAPIREVTIHP